MYSYDVLRRSFVLTLESNTLGCGLFVFIKIFVKSKRFRLFLCTVPRDCRTVKRTAFHTNFQTLCLAGSILLFTMNV